MHNAAMSQQPRRSGRRRTLSKRLQESHNLPINNSVASGPRPQVPPIPKFPTGPPPPPPPPPLLLTSDNVHIAYSSSVCKVMQRVHSSDTNPSESQDPVIGSVKATKLRKRQRSPVTREPPSLFNQPDWSRISVPPMKTSVNETSRSDPIGIPFVNMSLSGVLSTPPDPSANIIPRAMDGCGSEEESQGSFDHTVPSWHKTRQPHTSLSLPPTNNRSSYSPTYPTPAFMNSNLKSSRKFHSLLNSESTSESSLTPGSSSKLTTSFQSGNEFDSEPEASRSEPCSGSDEEGQSGEDREKESSDVSSEESTGSHSKDLSSTSQLESENVQSRHHGEIHSSRAFVNNSVEPDSAIEDNSNCSSDFSGAKNTFRSRGDVSGSATDEADDVDAFDMFLQEKTVDCWYRNHYSQDPIEVRVTELPEFLYRHQPGLWINPPLELLNQYASSLLSEVELRLWSDDKRSTVENRRVMIWDSFNECVLPFEQSPLISKLRKTLQNNASFEVLSLKYLTQFRTKEYDHTAFTPSNGSTNAGIRTTTKRTGLTDLAISNQTGVGDKDDATSHEDSKFSYDAPKVKDLSSDNSTDTQPGISNADVARTPEFSSMKDENMADVLKEKTDHRNDSQSGTKPVRSSSGTIGQPTDVEKRRGENLASVLSQSTHSFENVKTLPTEDCLNTNGKRRNTDTFSLNSAAKKLKATEFPVVGRTQSTSQFENSDETVNPLLATNEKGSTTGSGGPLILRLRLRPDSKGTLLRLRLRPQKSSAKKFSISKPKFDGKFRPKKGTYFKSVVFHKIIARLRHCGLLPHDTCPNKKDPVKSYMFASPVLWDTYKLEKVASDKVPKRNEDVFKDALLFNPNYESYTGQDLILKLGVKDHVQLIQVSADAPASMVMFWNRRKRKPQRQDNFKGMQINVGRVVKAYKNLDLYIGQDYRGDPVYRALRATVSFYGRRSLGLIDRYWALVIRPIVVTELVVNGWTPKIVSGHFQVASKSVFWDRSKLCLHLAAVSKDMTLFDYLNASNGRFEPYQGQDLSTADRLALESWCDVLQWGPGCRDDDMIFLLTGVEAAKREIDGHKRKRIPRSYNSVLVNGVVGGQAAIGRRRLTSSEKRDLRRERDRKRRERKKLERERNSENGVNVASREILTDNVERKDSEDEATNIKERDERTSKRQVSPDELDEEKNEVDMKMDKFHGCLVSSSRAVELRKLDRNARVLVRHKKFEVVLPKSHCPRMKDLSHFLQLNTDYELFDAHRHQIVINEGEKYLMAKLLARRQANYIREVISTLMLRTSQGDSLEQMRDLVEEELSVCGDFEHLLKTMVEGESVDVALKLLKLLEELDVFDFFTFVGGESSWELEDLSSIRTNFESGDLCLAHDVMSAFRKICSAQIQYHFQNKVMHEAAVTLFSKGEQTFAYFYEQYHEKMKRDRYLYRIRDLANRAGYQMKEQKSIPNNIVNSTSKIVQRNAFMNFRDESGNSIMSQGVSSRVLGILVDNQPGCLDTIKGRGHWKIDNKCHNCARSVAQPYDDALLCANRLFSECTRIVCRSCLLRKGMNPLEFKKLRRLEEWICSHCNGLCRKAKKSCLKKEIPINDLVKKEVQFGFDCEYTNWVVSEDIRAVFTRRALDGKSFETIGSQVGVSGSFGFGENSRLWQCQVALPVGIYRVKMLVEKKHSASTVLYVLPSRSPDKSCNGETSNREYSARRSTQPIVYWKVGGSIGDEVPQSILAKPIVECSRTEGYDWTVAKRHSLQLFRPDITGDIPPQLPTCIGVNFLPQLPLNDELETLKKQESNEELYHRVMRVEGRTHGEYVCALNTKRFKKMQKESLWGLFVARSRIHGSGLFSLSGFGTGDFIVEYAGELIRSPLADVREPRYDEDGFGSYMFRLDESHVVDATIHSNRARFVNHSCDPNMQSEVVTANGRKLVVFRAIRPIPPFSELTFDYQLPIEDKKMNCLCKAWNCTGVMN